MYRPPGQKNEPSEPISISCRFVATDQWLRTHVDPHWTISELKRHLLARCVGGVPLVPLGSGLGLGTPGPRLLVPSQSGQITLASLVRPPRTAPMKAGGRPSTAPHALLDDRRKPRLSLKVVPNLAKPGTISGPRTVTIHPPTPGIFGIPTTGPHPAPSVYFSPRNPVSSPERSPPSLTPRRTLEDDPSPPSPNMQPETISVSSRSTVALGYFQPQSHTTSPTYSQGTSPPSRPFSPTLLPQPPESQPLFTPNSEHSLLFSEFASTTPSASGPLPSPYAPATTRSPPPPITARSPPYASSLSSRYEASISITDSSVLEFDVQSRSPLLSAAEFFRLPESETEPEPSLRSPSPPPEPSPPFVHRPTAVYAYDTVGGHGIPRKRSGSREKNGLEEEFRLVSFAQGCILDEHSTVADLRIRPGELLEIQRKNAIVHLARPTYTQPYFEAPIYMIKRAAPSSNQRPHTSHQYHHQHHSHIPSRPHQHHIQPHRDYSSHRTPTIPPTRPVERGFPPQILPTSPIESVSSAGARGRSGTVTARDRDTYDGVDPDMDEGHDYAELDMSGLDGVGGGAPLPTGGSGGTTSGWSETSIKPPEEKVEWKLRWLVLREGKLSISRSREKPGEVVFTKPLSTLLSAQQLPATPQIGSLPRSYISMHFTGPTRKERGRDEGIGIRMTDGAVHVHLFRVLLRIINTGAHAWLPTDTPIIAWAPLASQYPEWRQYIVQRAWLAGRGTCVLHGSTVAGPWMRYPWVAWTNQEAESFVDSAPSESDADYETDSSDEHLPELVQTRDSDSEIEWDNEAWRAWESETAFGTWSSGGSSWLRLGSRVEMGRPRSRSLATPSRSSSQQQMQARSSSSHHETLLSPVSTSSEVSAHSPKTRRARSSTIAGPDSPGNSPQAWTRTGAGIETVLRTPASTEAIGRASNQSRVIPGGRRGSATSLEMQRAMPPSRRAVTTPAQGSISKFL
ncbi:unnamed protein product [Rhizoctonia solani]|uniref:Uncharacterized protein n=1 Tax=Rhizoctonia solani TaxID=456999 RepID=A0A8H3CWD7_9AGAM|nr:unnamed protein product [Rhizoctonia solani]